VGVSKVGGIFVHKQRGSLFLGKSTFVLREGAMPETPRPDQQAAAEALVAELQLLVEGELRATVDTLQQAEPATLFGATEFTIRDLALRIAAKAYQQRLDQKKMATKAPV
jgi:hypothetical protein